MSKKKVTIEQQEMLLGWLENHVEIAAGRFLVKYGKARLDQEWAQIARHLNSLGVGAKKHPEKWQQAWRDWKGNIRKKVSKIREELNKTGGDTHDSPKLTPIEERIVAIIGVEGVPEAKISSPSSNQDQWAETDIQCTPSPTESADVDIKLFQYAETSPSTRAGRFPSCSKAVSDRALETPRRKRNGEQMEKDKKDMLSTSPKKAKAMPTTEERLLNMEERLLSMEEKKLEIRERELELEARRMDVEERKLEVYGSLGVFLTKATELAQRYLDHLAVEPKL